MRVTLIRDDNLIIVDGRAINVDLSDLPADLHAVQWFGTDGHVERQGLPNQPIASLGDFQTWISRWNEAAAALDAPPPPPTPDQILAAKKAERQAIVDAIVVTVSSGKVFDGNEEAQSRMSRAIQTAEIASIPSTTWVLANNVPTLVTLAELKEALVLSMQAMGAVWATPYED
jgi:hypothetical protein